MKKSAWKPRVGDWVTVRSAAEILATLDDHGDLECMPFMTEMLRYAGQRFQVLAVAHKTCDTVNQTGGRTVTDCVHLDDLRCDGAGHGGCQAACLLFWKADWLRPANETVDPPTRSQGNSTSPGADAKLLAQAATRTREDGVAIYRCQATTLPQWSKLLKWWDVRQYWRDVRYGNVSWQLALRVLFLATLRRSVGLPYATRLWVALLERSHRWLMGGPAAFARGLIPNGSPTPDLRSNLGVGERVRVKAHEDIRKTINFANKNRGLSFDPEMSVYCGQTMTVAARVERIINEKTGEMLHFSNPCIRLEGAVCKGLYSPNRHLCPRRITSYFREIWLERDIGDQRGTEAGRLPR